MSSYKYFLILPILLIATSCVSYGPIKEQGFKSILSKDINVNTDDLVFTTKGRLTWNIDGFSMQQIGKAKDIERRGIIVISKDNVHFAEWKDNSYKEIWKVSYKTISAVELKSFGLNRLVVTRYELDGKPMTGSVTALDDSLFEIDAETNEKICNLIANNSKTTCSKDG